MKTKGAAKEINSRPIEDVINESQYTGLDKELREPESAYDAISPV